MPYCPKCGGAYDSSAKFCPGCGRSVTADASDAAGPTVPPEPSAEVLTPRLRTRVPGFVRHALAPGEPVLAAFNASLFDHHRQGTSLAHDKFVLTPQRLIFYHTGLFHKGMGEMPFRMITGVNLERGVFHGKVIVEAANAGLTLDGIGNDDAAFAEKIIAGGMNQRSFTVSGPGVEPPLVSPLVVILFCIIALGILAFLVAGPALPFPHLP
jgi:Bacterial PH domain